MRVDSDLERSKMSQEHLESDDGLVYAALTDVGLERPVNEDRCAVIATPHGVCHIVLDGMGGVEGGDFAAQVSVEAVRRCLLGKHRQPVEAIRDAFEEANRAIMLRRQNLKFSEMGTTIVGVIIEGSSVAIAHVGDSRAYLVSGDSITQLTVDHTYVQQLVERNEITREEALPHPQSHILTQCLGFSSYLHVEAKQYWIWPLEDGRATDFVVMCTDGLYSMVGEDEIASIVTGLPPRSACEQLIKLANGRGGFDNITVSVVPLHGYLRDIVSPTRSNEVKVIEHTKKVEEWWRRSFLFHLAFAAIGGFLAAALAVMALIYLRVF